MVSFGGLAMSFWCFCGRQNLRHPAPFIDLIISHQLHVYACNRMQHHACQCVQVTSSLELPGFYSGFDCAAPSLVRDHKERKVLSCHINLHSCAHFFAPFLVVPWFPCAFLWCVQHVLVLSTWSKKRSWQHAWGELPWVTGLQKFATKRRAISSGNISSCTRFSWSLTCDWWVVRAESITCRGCLPDMFFFGDIYIYI